MWRFMRFLRKLTVWTGATGFFAGLLYAAFITGTHFSPISVYAAAPIIQTESKTAPVMDRIAKCESSGTSTRDGQTLIHPNKDGSVDVGRYQINSTWNKKATELGYNLSIDHDNEAFAYWLYNNIGTGPWSSSSKCWNK